MLAALLLFTLVLQAPAQQPATAAKPKAHATQSKAHHSSSTKQKSKTGTSSSAPHDTTKAKP
jgi:hypothetical protein